MEVIYAKYRKIFRDFKVLDRKCKIMIWSNYEAFLQATRKPKGVGGFYMPGRYQLCAYHGMFGTGGDTSMVLAHEGCHLMQDLLGMFGNPGQPRSPIWLLEGMAVLFEAAEINLSTGKVRIRGTNRDRLIALQEAIRTGKYIKLRDLMNTPHRAFGPLHYAHAGMLTYWLLCKAGKKYNVMYTEYIRIATGGSGSRARRIDPVNDFAALCKKFLHKDIDRLEKEWLKWVKKQEPVKLGEMRGNKFVSKEMGFEVERPSGWTTAPYDKMNAIESVAFEFKAKDARIGVLAIGNMMGYDLKRYLSEHEQGIRKAQSKGDIQNYRLLSQKDTELCGLPAVEMIYECAVPKSRVSPELRRRARVYLVLTERVYMVTVSAPPGEKFDWAYGVFKTILPTFKVLVDTR